MTIVALRYRRLLYIASGTTCSGWTGPAISSGLSIYTGLVHRRARCNGGCFPRQNFAFASVLRPDNRLLRPMHLLCRFYGLGKLMALVSECMDVT